MRMRCRINYAEMRLLCAEHEVYAGGECGSEALTLHKLILLSTNTEDRSEISLFSE